MTTRLRRLATDLAAADYDAFLITQRPNQLYLVPHPEPVSGLPPIPALLIVGQEVMAFPGPMFYYACRDQLTQCQVRKSEVGDPDALEQLVDTLRRRDLRRVVCDRLPPGLLAQLAQASPRTRMVEDTAFGPRLRRTKEPTELELLRRAAAISDLGMEAAFRAARPGVTNRDIAAEGAYVMLKAGCEEVGMQVVSGPGVAYMGTGNWTLDPRRTVKEGDMVLVDMGILYHGYLGDQTRTAVVGEGTRAKREIVETIQHAYRATRDAMRPGARSAQLYQITVDILAEKGWCKYFPHHISHGLGLGGDLPRVAADGDDVLQVGDTLSCEPGVYIPGVGGARFENMLWITEDGAVELTQSAADPRVGR